MFTNSNTSEAYEKYSYDYDESNRLQEASYIQNGTELLNYDYGNLNDTSKSTLSITGEPSYDALLTANYNERLNRITSVNDKFTKIGETLAYTVNYSYNNKGQITGNSSGKYSSSVAYDAFDRLSNYTAKYDGTKIIDKTYAYSTYTNGGTTYTTNKLKTITDNLHGGTMTSVYNMNGCVSTVIYGGKKYIYQYDSVGRLSSEAVQNASTFNLYKHTTFAYDENNSIIEVNASGTKTYYSYDSQGRIASYSVGGVSKYFRYDAMGNATMYNGETSSSADNLEWTQGRKLERGTLNGNSFYYGYDTNGMRYKKTVNGNETEYYLDGTRIVAENRKTASGDNLIYYLYDMMGLSGMIYNGEPYYYEKNTLGDIIGIRDKTGNLVANYEYDAWGNSLTKTGTMADINPFRYRGYYYDNETGFYYLQTRYYDPTIRRFINADNYELLPVLAKTLGQLNLYAYANNNPLMNVDMSGEGIVALIVFLAAFTLIGAGVGTVRGIVLGHTGWDLVGDIALGAGIGLATGGLLAATGAVFHGAVGYAKIFGIAVKRAFALGAAVYDIMGAIIGPLIGRQFEMIEIGGGNDDPINTNPNISRDISSYYIVGENV